MVKCIGPSLTARRTARSIPFRTNHPRRRLAAPPGVEMILDQFRLDNKRAFVTGSLLVVDGGWMAR